MSPFSEEQQFVAHLARRAAEVALRHWGHVQGQRKPDGSLVTRADLEMEELLRTELGRAFPHDAILGEEQDTLNRLGPGRVWVLDPLDGTLNFCQGFDLWAVSIGLLEHGLPVRGVVYIPRLQRLYEAESGAGAALNGRPIVVSRESHAERNQLLGVSSKVHLRYFIDGPLHLRSTGAASINLVRVADGAFVGCFQESHHLWDIAAALAILRESGALVSDLTGAPVESLLSFPVRDLGPPLLAAAPAIHSQLLGLIRPRSHAAEAPE